MRTSTWLALLTLLCSVGVTGCDDEALFQAPPREGEPPRPPAVSDSVITLVASLPYTTLTPAAENKLPKSVAIGGDGHVACLDVPYVNPGHVGSHQECFNKPYLDFRGAGTERVCVNVPDFTGPSIGTRSQCADYHWNADVAKDGPLRLSKSGTDLHVEQGIQVTGKAGLGGTLADILSMSGKGIDVHVASALNLSAGLDKQWCPVVKATPVGRWVDSASVEIVGRNCVGIDLGALGHPELCAGPINLGLADRLNAEFDKHRGDIENTARSILPCDSIRSKVAEQWRSFSIKVERSGQAPLFVNIDPKSAGFSGLIAEDSRIKMAVRVGAKTVLSPTAMAPTGNPLPPLDSTSADQGSLTINLQAVAPYDFLKNELGAALKGQTFKKQVPGGTIEVTIEDVDLYPSNGSLAVGLKILAKAPGRWFNTSGWVFLTGKPTPAGGGRAVAVENIAFATVLDNQFWSMAQGLFETEILSALKARATFDLSKEIDRAAGEVSAAIAKADVPGLKIIAGTPSITLAGVNVGADNLLVVAALAMTFDVEITEALIK